MKISAFMQRFSIKDKESVKQLKILSTKDIILPSETCLHYIDLDPTSAGISGSHPFIVNHRGEINVYHEKELAIDGGKLVGNPKIVVTDYRKLERFYFKKQGRVRPAKNLAKGLKSTRSLFILDYSFLTIGVTYPENIFSAYNEWLNIRNRVSKGIEAVQETRHSFFMVNLPKVIPEISEFKKLTAKLTREQAALWHTHELLDLRDLWLFLQHEGELNKLSTEVREDATLVIADEGRSVVVPLRHFITKDEKEINFNQGVLYTLLMRIAAERTVIDNSAISSEEEISEEDAANRPFEGVSARIKDSMREMGEEGALTGADQRRILALAEKTGELENPLKPGTKLKDVKPNPPTADSLKPKLRKNPIKNITNPSLIESRADAFKENYVENDLKNDLLSFILKLKDAGIIIKSLDIEEEQNVLDHIDRIRISLVPVFGKVSTLNQEIPHFYPDGRYFKGGNWYNMETQRVDMPIRKTKGNQVALTSYYGKSFVSRSERAVDDYGRWLVKLINDYYLDGDNKTITSLKYGNSKIDSLAPVPLTYSILSKNYIGLSVKGYQLNFNFDKRFELYGEKLVKSLETKGRVVCGKYKDGVVLMSKGGYLETSSAKGDVSSLGRLETLLGNDRNVPRDAAVMKIFSKQIPICLVIAYLTSFSKMLTRIGAKYKVVSTGTRITPLPTDILIKFKDDTLIVDGRDDYVSLMLAGMRTVKDVIKTIRMDQLERQSGYSVLADKLKISFFHFNEMTMLRDLYIDPVTEVILREMKEPTTYIKLLEKAVTYLLNNDTPDETKPKLQRLRGVERAMGMCYSELVGAVREHRTNHVKKMAMVSLKPGAFMKRITKDTGTQISDDTNPISSLKERESVTLSGDGGRDAVSLKKKSRVFHDDDIGIISEATPDSSSAGIRTFMTPNAKLENTRGIFGKKEKGDPSSSWISSNALMIPGITNDDGKRMNMSHVQGSQVVPTKGNQVMPLSTPYSQVIGMRSPNVFAFSAPSDGKVVAVKESHIEVSTKEGSFNVPLGIRHHENAGAIIPNNSITDLKPGDKVEEGDILAWVDTLFERDPYNPRNVQVKFATMAIVAFKEGNEVLEDGSAINPEFAEELGAPHSKKKTITVDFDKNIYRVIKEGDEVDLETKLGIIQPETGDHSEITDDQLDALSRFGHNNPKAGFKGVVSRIEVFYLGDKNEMAPGLKSFVVKQEKIRKERSKDTDGEVFESGSLPRSAFVGGKEIEQNQVAIVVYMDQTLEAGIGDKIVLGAQLKSVIGDSVDPRTVTEQGDRVDIKFGTLSAAKRIVRSDIIIGVSCLTLRAISNQFVDDYES